MTSVSRNALHGAVLAMALAALLAGPAYPQGGGEEQRRAEAEQKAREMKAQEKAYKSATELIPTQQRPIDPWGNVRPNAATPSKTGR